MNPKATVEVEFRGRRVPARDYGTGGLYLEVATKVELAHAEGGFSEVHHEILQVPDEKGIMHTAVKIGIEIKGKVFYGTAQIKWGGQAANATDPIENAETSARGRALAAAGYELGHMSSAEDMDRVVEGNGHVVETTLALPEGMDWPGWTVQLAKTKGFTTKETFLPELAKATGKPVKGTYTTQDYQKAVEYFHRLPDPAPVASENIDEVIQ